jgi:hypothetical protein
MKTFLDSFVFIPVSGPQVSWGEARQELVLKEWGANVEHSLVAGGCLEGGRDYVIEREIFEI